jgi:hypothetical protein
MTHRHTIFGLLWTNEQPYAETSTCQHTTLTDRQTDRQLCPWRNSNPQSQPASNHSPWPETTRPLGSEFAPYIRLAQVKVGLRLERCNSQR